MLIFFLTNTAHVSRMRLRCLLFTFQLPKGGGVDTVSVSPFPSPFGVFHLFQPRVVPFPSVLFYS
jgi:hypothetical protein